MMKGAALTQGFMMDLLLGSLPVMTRGPTRGLVVALLLSSLPAMTLAFAGGAPDSTCNSMMPGHKTNPQNTASPFLIQIRPWETSTGRQLFNITLSGEQGADFIGFMVQARPHTGGNAVGSFQHDPKDSQTLNCGNGIKNSVTHINKIGKKRVELVWEPPQNYLGDFVFNGTFVHDYSTFWVNVVSEKFQVGPRSDEGHARSTTTKPTRTSSSSVNNSCSTLLPMTILIGWVVRCRI